MGTLFGNAYTRSELIERIGDLRQIAGVKPYVLEDGPERGVRMAELRTGSGLRFDVALDRAMDIPFAEYCGRPLCWCSPAGVVAPSFYESEGNGWLRSFFGGLLTTCGLTQVGSACEEGGEKLGVHGRINNLPAQRVHWGRFWKGDELHFWIEGEVRQVRVFGENLMLQRRISTRLGANSLRIEDRVCNEGFDAAPLMILYHFNIGFPLLDAGSELWAPSLKVRPRDADAKKGLEEHSRFSGPVKGYREQVFYHEMAADERGWVSVALVNPHRTFGLRLSYQQNTLPKFVEWKMMGQGLYVVGLEPSNCWVEGRAVEKDRGELEWIGPGDEREYALVLEVVDDPEELEALRGRIDELQQA